MTNEQLDKVMKPYWELRFGDVELKLFNVDKGRWFGLSEDDGIICGCPEEDIRYRDWYYSSTYFNGGKELFDVALNEFLHAMKRYLNTTYNLNIETIV